MNAPDEVYFPLYDEDRTVPLPDDSVEDQGAVVSIGASGFTLHAPEELSQAFGSVLKDVPGSQLGDGRQGGAGLSVDSDEAVVEEVVAGLDGSAYAKVTFDPGRFAAGMVLRRWRCVPHGERYATGNGGKCPRHMDGKLVLAP